MNINTKFNVGDKIHYFDISSVKLIKANIIAVNVTLNEAGEASITYGLNLIAYCNASCEILDELSAWLGNSKQDDGKAVVGEEKYIFKTKDDFLDFVTGVVYPVTQVEVSTEETDGNSEKHSKQYKGDEQVVQRGQSNY